VVIDLLSNRASALLKDPEHRQVSLSEFVNKDVKWTLSLEESIKLDILSDKILTLSYAVAPASLLQILFSEAISRLIIKKKIKVLIGLTFRELENFIRDENHLPIFGATIDFSPEEAFLFAKNSLIQEIFFYKLENLKLSLLEHKTWENLNLVERNIVGKELVSAVNKLFSPEESMELVIISKEEMVVKLNHFPLSLTILEKIFSEFLVLGTKFSSFKFVAV
jgi:hypothetical protein